MPRIGASNNNNTYTRTRTLTTDSAAFSDQHPSTAYRRHSDSDDGDDDDDDEGTSTDSTGNHRHLEATPARALSAHEHRRLDRAQQNKPFSTATLDGINISHAVHWLANKQIRSVPGPPTTTVTTTTAVRSERLPLPLPIQHQEIPAAASTHQQHKHSTLRKNPTSSLLSAANKVPASAPPAALSTAPFPHPSTIHSHRPSAPSPPPPAHTEQQQQQQQLQSASAPEPEPASARTAPLPVPEPMPQYASTSAANMSFARLPDMTGLTSAMGTPGRPLHAFHHIPVDPAYPAPRTRSSRPPAESIAPVHAQAQAQAKAPAPVQVQANQQQQHPVLNLRARVETDEDSDDDSGSGESESVMHFPLTNTKQQSPATPKKRHAATTVSLRPAAAAAAPSALVPSESVASDSHPHLFLQGLDHPRNQNARSAEEAARRFGVEWEGANPPLSAYAVEQLELQQLAATQKSKQKARSTSGSSPSPPVVSPGESTAKLNHMHDELAKIVDRLGRLEAESAPPPQAREGAAGGGYRRRGARAGPFETDSSGTEGGNNPPALSRGAIKDMQAHMRELMREMQRQRRAMASLVELEKDEVRDEIEAGEKVRRSLGLPPPPAAAAAGELELERRGRRTSARDAPSGAEGGGGSAGEEGRRRLPSPSKTIRQKRLRMERTESEAVGAGAGAAEAVAEARPAAAVVPPSSWSGDPHALRSHMGDVMRHVHLLRDEVERGLHPGSSHPVDRQTASSPLQADRNDVFDHRPASPFLRPTRETRSSPPPATQHRPSEKEDEDEGGMDVSRIAQERAAEAFAKVRQYSELRRAPAPSPPSKRGPSLFPEQQRSVSTQTQNQARNGAMLADEPVHRDARAPAASSSSHDLEHNERDCGVCQAPVKAAQRREARRDRVRREDRERRRGSGQESNADTEEEEVLIDLLVEEAERHRKLIARNGRNNNNRGADQREEEAAADPVSSWRDLIVLSPAQRESLIRMAKQHMDEFIHQRMLYAELADELKGVHPGMNAMRRRILGEHVMEAVELLEMKAERINVLQKLLGLGSARDDEYEGRQQEEEEEEVEERRRRAVRASKYEARPQRVVRPKVSSRLRHEVEAELASDYSDAEDPEEERIHLSAAAAAAAAAAATRATSVHRLRQQRSTSPVLPDAAQRQQQTRAQHSSMSSKGSPPRQNSGSRPVSRASRPRGLQTEYSPPTTLAAREIAGDLQDDDEDEQRDGDETEVGTDDGFGLDSDLGGGGGGGGGRHKAEGRAGSRQQQQRYAFGMGAGEQQQQGQGRPRSARTAGSGSSVGQAFGGGRRSRP